MIRLAPGNPSKGVQCSATPERAQNACRQPDPPEICPQERQQGHIQFFSNLKILVKLIQVVFVVNEFVAMFQFSFFRSLRIIRVISVSLEIRRSIQDNFRVNMISFEVSVNIILATFAGRKIPIFVLVVTTD